MDDIFKNPLRFEELDPHLSEGQKDHFAKLDEGFFQLAQSFSRCFTSPDGKKVIEHLRKMTIEEATWRPSLGGKQAIYHGFAREGQNALVRWIEKMIADAETMRKNRDEALKRGKQK